MKVSFLSLLSLRCEITIFLMRVGECRNKRETQVLFLSTQYDKVIFLVITYNLFSQPYVSGK